MLFNLKGRLLEFSTGEYNGNPYAVAKIRSKDIADNSILRYKVNLKSVGDVSSLVDSDVSCDFVVERGMQDSATVRLTKIEKSKASA